MLTATRSPPRTSGGSGVKLSPHHRQIDSGYVDSNASLRSSSNSSSSSYPPLPPGSEGGGGGKYVVQSRPRRRKSALLNTVDQLMGELQDCMAELEEEDEEEEDDVRGFAISVGMGSPPKPGQHGRHESVSTQGSGYYYNMHHRSGASGQQPSFDRPSKSPHQQVPRGPPPPQQQHQQYPVGSPLSQHQQQYTPAEYSRGSSFDSGPRPYRHNPSFGSSDTTLSPTMANTNRMSRSFDLQRPLSGSTFNDGGSHRRPSIHASYHSDPNKSYESEQYYQHQQQQQNQPVFSDRRSSLISSAPSQTSQSNQFSSSGRTSSDRPRTQKQPFTTPKTLASLLSLPTTTKSGPLQKQSPNKLFGKSYKKKFFILSSTKLYQFQSANEKEIPSSVLELTSHSVARVAERGVGVWEVSGTVIVGDGVMIPFTKVEKTWTLMCTSGEREMMFWVESVRAVVKGLLAGEARMEDVFRGRSREQPPPQQQQPQQQQAPQQQQRSKSRPREQQQQPQHQKQDSFDPRYTDRHLPAAAPPPRRPPPPVPQPSSDSTYSAIPRLDADSLGRVPQRYHTQNSSTSR